MILISHSCLGACLNGLKTGSPETLILAWVVEVIFLPDNLEQWLSKCIQEVESASPGNLLEMQPLLGPSPDLLSQKEIPGQGLAVLLKQTM